MGPTGCGKSGLALGLAQDFPASGGRPVCVINADSRQVYRDFPLITAQPDASEQNVCPHHLYGFLPSESKMSAGNYAVMAAEVIARSHAQGFLPILVGGTGLYIKSLLEGIAPIPPVEAAISRRWQERADAEGAPALHRLLSEHDPLYAAKIHPNDRQRVTRALEVLEGTGKAFSWWHAQTAGSCPYDVLKIGVGLPLEELTPLLGARIDKMLARGALEEASVARELCGDAKAPGWSGIGCAELYQYLAGEISLDECRELWLNHTRAYAKRQLTWFKGQETLEWVRPDAGPLVKLVPGLEKYLVN